MQIYLIVNNVLNCIFIITNVKLQNMQIHDAQDLKEITLNYILVYYKCSLVHSAVHFNHISKIRSNYEITYKDGLKS